jgi:hypothetical protein
MITKKCSRIKVTCEVIDNGEDAEVAKIKVST